MTFVFHVLPVVMGAYKPKKKKKAVGSKPKYNHWEMIQDRIGGMSWSQVAEKHSVSGGPAAALSVCMNSKASKKLKPSEVKKLFEVGCVRVNPYIHPTQGGSE